MTTFMSVSSFLMVLVLFLQQVPALVAAAKGAWTAVSGFIGSLFQKKS